MNRINDEEMSKQRPIDETLCSVVTEQCCYHDCKNRSNRCPSDFLRNYFNGDEDDTVEWANWKRTYKRVVLLQIADTMSLLLNCIDEQWEDFLGHHYYTKVQELYIGNIKKVRIFAPLKHIKTYLLPFFFVLKWMPSPNDVVVVQMDLSALLSQHEVQSAHFDKSQATIFTAFVVMGSEHKNFVIIIDYLEHVRTRLHFLFNAEKNNLHL